MFSQFLETKLNQMLYIANLRYTKDLKINFSLHGDWMNDYNQTLCNQQIIFW